jgi:O-antigen/teichoic acid export membrane protein
VSSAPTSSRPGGQSLAIVAGNSSWSLIAFLVGVISNLITLPFVIKQLGILQFGMCGLFLALSAPLSLVGMALGQATAQGIARFRSLGDQASIVEFCSTMLAVAGVCVLAVGAFLCVVSPPIVRLLSRQDSGVVHSLATVSLTLSLGWAAQQLSFLIQGVHVGCQAYRRIATVNTFGALGSVAIIFTVVGLMPRVQGYILALATGYGLTLCFWVVSLSLGFRWCAVRPRLIGSMSRSIGAFIGWQMLAQLVANVSNQVDRYLLGAWVNPSAVGYYNVSQRVEEVAYIGVLRAGDVLFPQFSQNADASLERRAGIFLRACWMLNLLAAMVLAPMLPWGAALLSVWVGLSTANHAYLVLQVLTISGLLGCAGNVFGLYALGTARTRYIAILSLTTAVTSAVATIVLLRSYGFVAAGMGGAVDMLANLSMIIALTVHHFRSCLTVMHLLTGILLPIGCGLLIAGVLWLIPLPQPQNWFELAVAYGATSIGILLLTTAVTACVPGNRASLQDLSDILRLPKLWHSRPRPGA